MVAFLFYKMKFILNEKFSLRIRIKTLHFISKSVVFCAYLRIVINK